MRLGAWKCDLKQIISQNLRQSTISERHRHRYEAIVLTDALQKQD
jgi:CTP synthase (UTP-ammonia lyase)